MANHRPINPPPPPPDLAKRKEMRDYVLSMPEDHPDFIIEVPGHLPGNLRNSYLMMIDDGHIIITPDPDGSAFVVEMTTAGWLHSEKPKGPRHRH